MRLLSAKQTIGFERIKSCHAPVGPMGATDLVLFEKRRCSQSIKKIDSSNVMDVKQIEKGSRQNLEFLFPDKSRRIHISDGIFNLPPTRIESMQASMLCRCFLFFINNSTIDNPIENNDERSVSKAEVLKTVSLESQFSTNRTNPKRPQWWYSTPNRYRYT